jgi:hypothetical protein
MTFNRPKHIQETIFQNMKKYYIYIRDTRFRLTAGLIYCYKMNRSSLRWILKLEKSFLKNIMKIFCYLYKQQFLKLK